MRFPILLLITSCCVLMSGCNKADVAAAKPPKIIQIGVMGARDPRRAVDSGHIQLGEVWEFKLHVPSRDCGGLPIEAFPWTGRVEFLDDSWVQIGDVVPILPLFSGEEKLQIDRSSIREMTQIDSDKLPALRDASKRMMMAPATRSGWLLKL